MKNYSELLKKSIGAILKKEEEKEVSSLFKAGGTIVLNKNNGTEDFNLVTFLIVK
jgi:hypothetical protein